MPRKKRKGRIGRPPKQRGRGKPRNQAEFVATATYEDEDEETQFEDPTMEEIDIKEEEEDDDEVLDDNMFLAIENEMKLIENANRMAQEKQVECVTLLEEPSTSSMACHQTYMINNQSSIGSVTQPIQQLIVAKSEADVPTANHSLLIPRSTINQSIVHSPIQQLESTNQRSLLESMQPRILINRLPQTSVKIKICEFCQTKYKGNNSSHTCKLKFTCYRCHTDSLEPKLFADHLENTHDVTNSLDELKLFMDINFREYKMRSQQCYLCTQQFKFLNDLEAHVKIDHKLCRVCGVRLPTDDKASLHIERHDKLFVDIYQCSVCGMESPFYQLSAIHKLTHSSPYTTFKKWSRKHKEHNCPYCYFFTSSLHSMIFHISLHQPSRCKKCKRFYLPFARHIFDQRFNECSACNPIPITSELLPLDEQSQMKLEYATIVNAARNEQVALIPTTSASVGIVPRMGKSVALIPRTGKSVTLVPTTSGTVALVPLRREPVTLTTTRNMVANVVSYPCLYCREVFRCGMELYAHIKTRHIVCAICCKKFSTVLKLNEHFVEAHTMYKCKTCGRVYDSKKMVVNHLTQNHLNLHQNARGYTTKLPEIDMHKVTLLSQCSYCLADINPANYTSHMASLHEIEKCSKCSCFKSMNFPCSECFEFVDPVQLEHQTETLEEHDPLADPLQQEHPSIVSGNENVVAVNLGEEIIPDIIQPVCKETQSTPQILTVTASATNAVEMPETIVGGNESPEEITPDSPESDLDTGAMNNDSDSDFEVIESSKEPEKESSPVAQDEPDKTADTSQFVPILPMPADATEEMRLSKLKRLIRRKVKEPTPTKTTAVQLRSILPTSIIVTQKVRSDAQKRTEDSNEPITKQQPTTKASSINEPTNNEPITITIDPPSNEPSTSQPQETKQKVDRRRRYKTFEQPDTSKHITIEELRVFLTEKDNFEEKLEQYFYHTFGEIHYITPSHPAFVFKLSYTPQLNIEVDKCERIESIPCLFCTSIFTTLKEHFTHLIAVHRMCKVCHAPNPNFKALLHHLTLHEEGEYTLYFCTACVVVFSCYGEFTKHRNECKNQRNWRHGRKISTKMSQLQCPYCCLNFFKEDVMIKHVLSVHKVKGFKCVGVEEIEDEIVEEEQSGPAKSADGDGTVVSTRPYLVPSRKMWDNLLDIKDLCKRGEPVEDHLIDYCYTLPSIQFYLNHDNVTVFVHRISFRPNYTIEAEVSSRIKCVPCLRCDVRCDSLRSHFEHQIKVHFECKTCQVAHKQPMDLINHFVEHESGVVHLFNCDDCLFVCLSRKHWYKHCESQGHRNNQKMKQKKLSAKVGAMECPYCCLNFVEELEMIKHIVKSHQIPNFAFTFNDTDDKDKFVKDLLKAKPWQRTGPRVVRKSIKKVVKPTKRKIPSPSPRSLRAKRKRILSETEEEKNIDDDKGSKDNKSRELKNLETSMTSDVLQVRSRRRAIRMPARYLDNLESREPVTIEDLEKLYEEGQPVEEKLLEFCYHTTSARIFYIQHDNPIFIFCYSAYQPSVKVNVETSTRITSVQCQYCDANFDTLKGFYEHQIQVHYICKSCQIVLEDPRSLIRHWKEHEEEKIQLHFCRSCALIIPTAIEWRRHVDGEGHIYRGNFKHNQFIAARVGDLECPRCCLNFVHELDLIAHVSRWHQDLNFKFELREGEAEVLAKKTAVPKSKAVRRPPRKRKVSSSSSDSSSDSSDGPEVVDDSRASPDEPVEDYRKKRRSGCISMARIAQTYSGIKVETNLDELEELLSRDELINDHLVSYCYNANSLLSYIREIRPVFVHLHSSKQLHDIQVEASNSITSVPCQFCGIHLKSLYTHVVHLIKAHHACKKCMITHKNSKELLDHFKLHRDAEIQLPYCKHCGLTFHQAKKFEKHCKSNHGFVLKCVKPISARIGELECPYCFSSFYKEIDLILHVLKSHRKMQIEYKDGKNKTLLTMARNGEYDSDSENEQVKPAPKIQKKKRGKQDTMDAYNTKIKNGDVKLAQLEASLFGDPIEDQLIDYCYNRYADIYYFRTKNIKFMYLYSLHVTQGVLTEPCVRITNIPCLFCPVSFPTLRDHVTHIMKEHFVCKTCQLEHHDVKSLIAHLKLHELGLICVFTCRPCCSFYSHMDDFCRHLMEKHMRRPGKDHNTRLDHREFIGSQILSAKIGNMECPYCPCNFADELALIRHVVEEHQVQNFTFNLLKDDYIDWEIPQTMNQPVENAENAMVVAKSENVMAVENPENSIAVENPENSMLVENQDIAMAVENADINSTTVENCDMAMENTDNAMAAEISNLIAMTVENCGTMAMEHSDTMAMENLMTVTTIPQTSQAPPVANQETVQTTNENLTDSDEDLASRLKRSKKEAFRKKKRTHWRNQSLFLADLPQMPKMDDLLALLRMGEPVAPLVAEYFFNVPSHNMFFRQKHAIFINVRKLADRINWLKVEESVRITCMPCQHCNSSFDNLTDFCSHLISAHYMCKMCELPHHDMEALIEHTRLHERGQIVIYYCRLVSKIFRSFEEHKKHARNCNTNRRHHRVCFRRPVSVKIGVLECPYCPINYTKELDLIQHIVVDHRIQKFEYQLLDTDEPVEFEIPPVEDVIPLAEQTVKVDETEQAVESVMEERVQADVTETMDSFEAPNVPDWSDSEDLIQPAIASPEPDDRISHLLVGVLDKLIRADELGHPIAKLLLEYCIQLPASSNIITPSLYLHVSGTQTERLKSESPTRITTIPCLYCAQVSNGLKSHFQHLISDHFFCKLCQVSHDTCMSLLLHLKLHESENINMYICKRSFVITSSYDAWRNHLEICTDESHSELTNLSMKLGTLECPYCPFNFSKQIELIQHVYYTHRVVAFDYEQPLCHVKVLNSQCFIYEMGETKITSGESPKILKNIPCKYCDTKSATLELHEKHLKEVHHLCKPCKKLHTDLCALKLHHIEHELQKIVVFACKKCPALLSNTNECKLHVKIHKGGLEKVKNISCTIGTLECPYCSLNFFAEIELVKHLVKDHKND